MSAHHRSYRVRLRNAVAGSLIAAASLTGVGVAPSVAASPTVMRPQGSDPSSADRLAGVRADLKNAVGMGMVTTEQAQRFYAQIERRVASGR
ncbi:hypothetical protein BJ994_002310 [Arthrobacter pigmenti]|uniref:Uncharacterized protein n=1 Tax=Arthrobacter pigmenti TaxID=271432 RepID=A0A846RS03_9MICC|nr:hypothetical protein [Arthrobacter pigmenti]NJC23234.1 hypothetical protein [Arthrobacter pigmenti]